MSHPDSADSRFHSSHPSGPNSELHSSQPPHSGWTNADSEFEPSLNDRQGGSLSPMTRLSGGRRQWLIALALLGAVGLAFLVQTLASSRRIDATWRATPAGHIELASSADPALRPHTGQVLLGLGPDSGPLSFTLDALALRLSSRWVIDDADRARQQIMHARLAEALAQDAVTLRFADAGPAVVRPEPRGVTSLPLMFWLLCLFGYGLYLVATAVLLANPNVRNRIYALMAWCQAANLVMIAIESTLELGMPEPFARVDMPLRMAFDLASAAAMVTAVCLHPRRLPGATAIATTAAGVAAALVTLFVAGLLPHAWWWTQVGVAVLGLGAIGLLSWSYRIEPHPFALVLRRFGILSVSTWVLLTVALATADRLPGLPHNIADIGSMVWYAFLGSLLMLVPFLAQTHSALREFSLLAAISTVAISLDLLFVSVFSISQFASLTLSLFVSLAVYSGARQWILNQWLGSSQLTAERMFEQLYRMAREVEAQPERAPVLLSRLLGDVFEPLEVEVVERLASRSRVSGDGSSMLVPLPVIGGDAVPHGAVMMRFAQRGRRLFGPEDARLTDRIVEQLRRAVNFDKAVEQGRNEERLRLAQDLHDDIGARLLTLMYKAQSPEMEDYVRHTLQDLKTLTRGLAASNHRLSHAAGEWKADLAHRLSAAHVELKWSLVFDEDILLTVVHWSALTRVLRELVSNTIAHSQAQQLEIDFRLENDRVDLIVSDNGVGTNPRAWSHGLGLGGVRKRVKQLGGSVEWREIEPHGISCRVIIKELSTRT